MSVHSVTLLPKLPSTGTFLRLGFVQSYRRKLRIDEHAIGHRSPFDGRVATVEPVLAQDAEIVVGNVREGRPAFHVADRIDARDNGLEFRVHLDEARIVGLDAGGAEVEAVGIRNTAEGKKQMASRDLP